MDERHGGGYPSSLQSLRELEVTREKLRLLEERQEADHLEEGGDRHLPEVSMISLERLINQLKEEIARFESRAAQKTKSE